MKSRTYSLPIRLEDKIEKALKQMIKWDIIRRATCAKINPLVPVLKKDGKIRLCLDARNLNTILKEDHEGTEKIETLLQRCNGKKYFSHLDLNMSFWQIPLTKESKNYTAFLYKGKYYEHNVTPFGLKTSTAAFVRGLDKVLKGLSSCVIIYIDDLLVVSEAEEQHLLDLENILKRLEEHNITLNYSKCEFKKKETRFLGHIISKDGIKQDPVKIQGIHNYITPINK